MNDIAFNYHSVRARKARFAVLFDNLWAWPVLISLILLALVGGVALVLLQKNILGPPLASLAVIPFMLLTWYKHELQELPASPQNTPTLDGVLAGNILGRLPANPSPRQIAEVIMRVSGGHFFIVRFGIGPKFLIELSDQTTEASQAVWRSALTLKEQVAASNIDATILVAALMQQIPGNDQLLAKLQLDVDDITAGVGWYHHIKKVIEKHKNRRITGGIGRDWSFGYTPQLSRFASNISQSVLSGGLLTRDIEGHQDVIRQITNQFANNGRQNAVLVGQAGVGKTTLVYAFAEQLMSPTPELPETLHYRQVMALDPASLIARAHGRGELENLLQTIFMEAHSAKNIILFLDEAQLFLQEGTGSVDLSNLLLPILEGGGLRLIMAMSEQRWLQLAQTNPSLTQYMNRINIAPSDKNNTMLVLEDQLLLMEGRYNVTYMYQSLSEAYRLGDRYVQDQAMPGKAIGILEAAAQFAENKLVTVHSVQQAVEKNYGVKVGNANAAEERDKLLNLEQLIHERMINQTRAVGVVSNALRRARAGVRNQDRPIGTFLFLGPTGVGKTELAKSLAAVYFGGEDHLVRLDLNEFGQAEDVNRLIADGAHDTNSLTAQIGKQPFSVVLLDEIEKAHPNVLNTLLQLLDEGILRDLNNREVSFRDAIIIATSNAGSERIRQYIDSGYQLEQFEKQFTNELISSGQFKPEFLNRFDEIVLFRPLKPEELLQVIDLILAGINRTLANQKVSVRVAEDAKQALVKAGYDPRLGARPMRRVVQRTVEDIIAHRMLSGQVPAGSVVEITLADIETALKND
jgi:ATP-dependent Clp protease ATP-binding subunit ClpC